MRNWGAGLNKICQKIYKIGSVCDIEPATCTFCPKKKSNNLASITFVIKMHMHTLGIPMLCTFRPWLENKFLKNQPLKIYLGPID